MAIRSAIEHGDNAVKIPRAKIPIKVIQEIENGKAHKNKSLWQKIARFLGVKI